MSDRNPYFSIVIPVFNREQVIEETILSVIDQTFKDFEIVIIDDGSTDKTRDVIKTKFESYDFLEYHYQENRERGAARNAGIKKSQGEYVVFLDSDDLMLNDHLETLYGYLADNPGTKFIATKFNFIDDNKHIYINPDLVKLKQGYYDENLFLEGNPLACNFAIKKLNPGLVLFEESPDYAIMEDWIFLVQNLQRDKLFMVDKVTMSMRDHSNRSMRANHQLVIQRRLNALNYLLNNRYFGEKQIQTLSGWSYYFCAIHHYIIGAKKQGFLFLIKAIKAIGFNSKFILLFLKILMGKRIVAYIKQ